MKKFKVLHLLHSVGGVDVSLRLILNSIDSDIFESIVIHGFDDTKTDFKSDKNENIKAYKTNIVRNISPIKDINSLLFIIKTIKKEKPDLIHCHSAKGGILGKLAAIFTKTPCLHTPQAYSYLSAENKLKRRLFLGIEKFFSRFDNKILASSFSEKNRAIKEVGYQPNQVSVFSNSILPILQMPDLQIPKTWPDEYICSVGRPSFQKNIEMMLQVLAETKKSVPSIHLVLMGVGFHSPNLQKVMQMISELNLQSNISMLEWTNREDIFHIIANAQLYISTARYEGLPYSVIESLALAKACVVSDADGNRDLIEDGKNGYVISSNNPAEFSEKIILLLKKNKLLKQFEAYSKIKFEKEFNMHKNINKLAIIYKEEIAKP